jgi:hypothetical protein
MELQHQTAHTLPISYWESLSDELLLSILVELDDKDLISACLSSPNINRFCESEVLWKDKIRKIDPEFVFREKIPVQLQYRLLSGANLTGVVINKYKFLGIKDNGLHIVERHGEKYLFRIECFRDFYTYGICNANELSLVAYATSYNTTRIPVLGLLPPEEMWIETGGERVQIGAWGMIYPYLFTSKEVVKNVIISGESVIDEAVIYRFISRIATIGAVYPDIHPEGLLWGVNKGNFSRKDVLRPYIWDCSSTREMLISQKIYGDLPFIHFPPSRSLQLSTDIRDWKRLMYWTLGVTLSIMVGSTLFLTPSGEYNIEAAEALNSLDQLAAEERIRREFPDEQDARLFSILLVSGYRGLKGMEDLISDMPLIYYNDEIEGIGVFERYPTFPREIGGGPSAWIVNLSGKFLNILMQICYEYDDSFTVFAIGSGIIVDSIISDAVFTKEGDTKEDLITIITAWLIAKDMYVGNPFEISLVFDVLNKVFNRSQFYSAEEIRRKTVEKISDVYGMRLKRWPSFPYSDWKRFLKDAIKYTLGGDSIKYRSLKGAIANDLSVRDLIAM